MYVAYLSIYFGLPLIRFCNFQYTAIARLFRKFIPKFSNFYVIINIVCLSQVLVAHVCNPSYSGGSYQEDYGLKPAWANGSLDLISKSQKNKTLYV
jgi:hypothetical protein